MVSLYTPPPSFPSFVASASPSSSCTPRPNPVVLTLVLTLGEKASEYIGARQVFASVQAVVDKAARERFGANHPNNLKIMLALDGRNVGKRGSQHSVLICISLLDEGKMVHAFEHLYPIGLTKAAEKYEDLKAWFPKLRAECEAVRYKGKVPEWYMGGDLKALLLVCGLPNAGSRLSNCLYGKTDMNQRRQGHHTCGFGCSNPGSEKSLIEGWIPRWRVVIDLLHLLLRVYDVLFRRSWLALVSFCGSGEKAKTMLEPAMMNIVRSFRIYMDKENRGAYKFSSINGNARLSVLERLSWSKLIPDKPTVGKYLDGVFRRFHALYTTVLNVWKPESHTVIQKACTDFMKFMLGEDRSCAPARPAAGKRALPGARRAYDAISLATRPYHFTRTQVMTCYMHYLECHMGHLVQAHGSLKPFEMQNLELHNNTDGRGWFCANSRRPHLELREMFFRQWMIIYFSFAEEQENAIIAKLTAPKPLCCRVCDKEYSRKANFVKHLKKEHNIDVRAFPRLT